ncbi:MULTISPECIES: type II toxin-antitoxin system VapC family toxin [Sinorhizobium]|jgi:ribonuclease VapC|uniref:Ribonuclease VapC n=4 Tax=Sinorhizobium TaxID=28105 RepID=H0FWD8_RHIML|nr:MULTISPECIES: type II toxin-antitoxin system VapC family toxin [Sinorhizobium]AEG52175.1 PilT protein domain protein [Sinorhizobium meliloti AK83]ASP79273.1 PIN domain nuclease [Sinorhizobium meliloti]ASP85373.1 PIN domain nuclease [Sinorhizobium meliloti]ASP90411.1 PIN domain nuclease [Sinorhizobium meliloti]EHK78565.1 PilT protein domain-containing protein [Sinorhizobium meliloti CCNWSX0020]
MMVVDSSAVVAIFQAEDDALPLADAMASADQLVMSAVNAHETAMILRARGGPESAEDFWRFLSVNGIEVAPFNEEQAREASEAFGRFGKGIHSKARLNLADCAAYALAKSLSAPLLFKGDDFIHTDIEKWR